MTDQPNPYRSPVDVCPDGGGKLVPLTRVAFSVICIALLLMAVAVSLMQKRWEGQVAIGVIKKVPAAERMSNMERARVSQVFSLSLAGLSLVAWCVAVYRREARRVLHWCVAALLTLFVLIQLVAV